MNLNEDNKQSNNENNPFSLPGDYFSAFSKKMMLKIELADELKEFKLLSSIPKKSPFAVPSNYFENKTELAEYPHLSSLKRKDVFDVPVNYFENSARRINNKLEAIEELSNYASLASIAKLNLFTTPAEYFDKSLVQLRSDLTTETKVNNSGKVIQFIFNKRTAYAMAAMLVMSLGLYFYNSKTEAASSADCNTLACLNKQEIVKDNQLNNLDDEALIEIVNTEQLSKNLKDKLKQENTKENQEQTNEDYVLENVDVNDITDEI